MLNLLAVFLVCSGIGIAVHIAIDLTHRPQSMKIMNAVWILTALWGSYLALWAYNKFGKSVPMKMGEDEMKMDMSMGNMPMEYPHWQSVALSALHCGAGCTLADIIGEWVTNYIPVTVAGSQLIGNWVFDFILAFLFMTCNWMPFGFENDLGVTGNTNGSFSERIINIESFGRT